MAPTIDESSREKRGVIFDSSEEQIIPEQGTSDEIIDSLYSPQLSSFSLTLEPSIRVPGSSHRLESTLNTPQRKRIREFTSVKTRFQEYDYGESDEESSTSSRGQLRKSPAILFPETTLEKNSDLGYEESQRTAKRPRKGKTTKNAQVEVPEKDYGEFSVFKNNRKKRAAISKPVSTLDVAKSRYKNSPETTIKQHTKHAKALVSIPEEPSDIIYGVIQKKQHRNETTAPHPAQIPEDIEPSPETTRKRKRTGPTPTTDKPRPALTPIYGRLQSSSPFPGYMLDERIQPSSPIPEVELSFGSLVEENSILRARIEDFEIIADKFLSIAASLGEIAFSSASESKEQVKSIRHGLSLIEHPAAEACDVLLLRLSEVHQDLNISRDNEEELIHKAKDFDQVVGVMGFTANATINELQQKISEKTTELNLQVLKTEESKDDSKRLLDFNMSLINAQGEYKATINDLIDKNCKYKYLSEEQYNVCQGAAQELERVMLKFDKGFSEAIASFEEPGTRHKPGVLSGGGPKVKKAKKKKAEDIAGKAEAAKKKYDDAITKVIADLQKVRDGIDLDAVDIAPVIKPIKHKTVEDELIYTKKLLKESNIEFKKKVTEVEAGDECLRVRKDFTDLKEAYYATLNRIINDNKNLSTLTDRIKELEKPKKGGKGGVVNHDACKKELKECQDKLKKQTQEVDNLNSDIKDLEEFVQSIADAEIEDYPAKIKELKETNEKQVKELNAKIKEANENSDKRVTDYKATCETWRDSIVAKNKKSLAVLQEKLDKATKLVGKEGAKPKAEDKDLVAVSEKLKAAEKELEKLKDESSKLKDESTKLKDESDKLKIENKESEAVGEKLKLAQEELKMLKADDKGLAAVSEKLKVAEKELKILKEEDAKLKIEVMDFTAVKEKRKLAEEELKALKDEADKLKTRDKDLVAVSKRLKLVEAELKALKDGGAKPEIGGDKPEIGGGKDFAAVSERLKIAEKELSMLKYYPELLPPNREFSDKEFAKEWDDLYENIMILCSLNYSTRGGFTDYNYATSRNREDLLAIYIRDAVLYHEPVDRRINDDTDNHMFCFRTQVAAAIIFRILVEEIFNPIRYLLNVRFQDPTQRWKRKLQLKNAWEVTDLKGASTRSWFQERESWALRNIRDAKGERTEETIEQSEREIRRPKKKRTSFNYFKEIENAQGHNSADIRAIQYSKAKLMMAMFSAVNDQSLNDKSKELRSNVSALIRDTLIPFRVTRHPEFRGKGDIPVYDNNTLKSELWRIIKQALELALNMSFQTTTVYTDNRELLDMINFNEVYMTDNELPENTTELYRELHDKALGFAAAKTGVMDPAGKVEVIVQPALLRKGEFKDGVYNAKITRVIRKAKVIVNIQKPGS